MHHTPKDIHILIPGPCDITTHGKMNSEDIIKIKDFKIILLGKDVMIAQKNAVMRHDLLALKMEEGDHVPKKMLVASNI